MARITRALQKIFGIDSGATGTTVFGSTADGSTAYSKDVGTIQSNNFTDGWLAAILAGTKRLPTYEDMNSVHYVCTSQLAYLFQEGIPEYDSTTTYYTNSIVKEPGTYILYGSKLNNNIGNPLADSTYWQFLIDFNSIYNIPFNIKTDNYILTTLDTAECFAMNSISAKAFTLPLCVAGLFYYLKNINSGTVTIIPNVGNTSEIITLNQNEAVLLIADEANNTWRAIGKSNVNSTESYPGISEIATQAEVNAGVDTIRYVTPATLHGASPLSYMPTGAVTAYAGTVAPSGYLMCDGSSQLISSYPSLSDIIRPTFGGADASHFYLPLLNDGSFIRGLGGNSDTLGVKQQDAVIAHRHAYGIFPPYGEIPSGNLATLSPVTVPAYISPGTGAGGLTSTSKSSLPTTNDTTTNLVPTATETRPLNMALNYIIKT